MDSRIGVFVCDCKGLVSDHLDTGRLAEVAAGLDGVAFVRRVGMLCGPGDVADAVRELRDAGADRLLVAGCSPRSSLKFPEERIERELAAAGLDPGLHEVANVREQCAWAVPDRAAATRKAIDTLRMAHARLVHDEAAPAPVPVPKTALVVGGGVAGLRAAEDLAAAGVDVTIVERNPYLGGRLCQLPRIFQSEGWPSVCDSKCVGPVSAKEVMLAPRVRALVSTTVEAATKRDGAFEVSLRSAPAFVDPELCISCGECSKVCPETAPRRFDEGLSLRKAIDKEFERALPDTYGILADACTLCGDCVPVCPTKAIDLEAVETRREERYGAVFLATGFDPIDLTGYPEFASAHPDVVSAVEFERIMERGMARPSDGRKVDRIVFVQCAGSRAGPEKAAGGVAYCSKTCCSVTAKQVDRLLAANPMAEATVVYYRDVRTYERALDGLYQKLRLMGIEFVNGELAGIRPETDGSLTLDVDPIVDGDEAKEAVKLPADLVVLASAQVPSGGSADLARMFGVRLDRFGFPIENQPRLFRPTESLVGRAFVVGASAGPKVVQQAAEQGSAAAMRALPALTAGAVAPPRHASRVSPDRCTGCRTCETVCPHGAIRMTPEGAVSDPAFCQACGLCAAACPVHAADLLSFTDRQILDQAEVAFLELPPDEPRILALLCYWCSYSAADFAGIERNPTPANVRTIRIRCSSSVNTGLVWKLFTLGVDGILVAGCPERSCHHLHGNFLADKRTEIARSLMSGLGLDPGRLRYEYIGAPMQQKFVATLKDMDERLRALGRNPAAAAAGRA